MSTPEGSPPESARDAVTAAYCPGSVRMITSEWFFAAERTMVGPPMSIISISSSFDAGGSLAAVSSNG